MFNDIENVIYYFAILLHAVMCQNCHSIISGYEDVDIDVGVVNRGCVFFCKFHK